MRIKNREGLSSHGNIKGRKIILDILEAGMEAADPYYNTKALVRIGSDKKLYIGEKEFVPAGSPKMEDDIYELGKDVERIFVVGAGKGIHRIAEALEEILGEYLTDGIIILKDGDEQHLHTVRPVYASHPIPTQSCVEASRCLSGTVKSWQLTEHDLIFTVFGNGSSSLMTLPCDGLSVGDVGEVTKILQIEKGAATPQVNMVRNQLDQLKGGRITRMLYPAKLVHLIPIDLDEPNALGGVGYEGLMEKNFWHHTLPDCSTPEKAMEVLKTYDVLERIPAKITEYLRLQRGKNSVLTREEFSKGNHRIFGLMPEKRSFLPAVMKRSKELGYNPYLLTKRTFVDAASTGQFVARIAANVDFEDKPFQKPCAILMTGELTVAVKSGKGIGGRNQEFALNAAKVIRNNKNIVIAAVDTDGTDGPGGNFSEDAWKKGCRNLAGGLVDGYTVQEVLEAGADIEQVLREHNTSPILWKTGCGIWATQNISIQDLIVVLVMGEGKKVS